MTPKVPRMDDAHARAWYALVSLGERLPQALDAQLTADAGLINFEYGLLGVLIAAPDHTMRAGELAARLACPAPRLSKAITRLAKRGLVERVACTDDGRAVNVHITRAGRRAWLAATPPHITLARDVLLGGLSPDQLAQLATLVETVLGNLDAAGDIPLN